MTTTTRQDDRTGATTTRAAAPLVALAVAANLAVLGLASLLGAGLTVDNNGTLMAVGVLEVILASALPLTLGIVAHVNLSARFDVVRRTWTPAILTLTVLSLGGLLGASDLTTGLALGTMHLVVGGLAAVAVPARLGS